MVTESTFFSNKKENIASKIPEKARCLLKYLHDIFFQVTPAEPSKVWAQRAVMCISWPLPLCAQDDFPSLDGPPGHRLPRECGRGDIIQALKYASSGPQTLLSPLWWHPDLETTCCSFWSETKDSDVERTTITCNLLTQPDLCVCVKEFLPWVLMSLRKQE